jgi:DNA-binding MarR family transcriptional regulator
MARVDKSLRPIREPVPLTEPGADIGVALRQVMQTLRQAVDSGLRARGVHLSFVHGMVLKTLAREPGISGAQLARRTTVTAQSMNGLLRSMESTQIVVREKHPENRRTDCWYITGVGLKQLEQAGEVVDIVMGRIRASISKADATRLTELLHQCAAALQSGAEEKPGRSRKAASTRTAGGRSGG